MLQTPIPYLSASQLTDVTDIKIEFEDTTLTHVTDRSTLSVALVGTTALFGEVFLTALGVAEPNILFTLYSSLDDWLANQSKMQERVLLLFLGNDKFTSTTETSYGPLERLKTINILPRVIVCANQDHYSEILKALKHGAEGYIVPSMSLKVVIQVIHLVNAGEMFVPASSFKDLTCDDRSVTRRGFTDDGGLSARQVLVAKALRKGTPNKIIAYELNMCESTVKVHVRHIMKKLNAKNRTQIAFLTNAMFSDEKDK